MLMQERKSLADALAQALAAMKGLIDGEITTYNLGRWSVGRNKVDLDKLNQFIKDTRIRIDEIDNILIGKSVRTTTTCVYGNPTICRNWWGL
jgi:hypothetical protein